jgi:hypothetical protein
MLLEEYGLYVKVCIRVPGFKEIVLISPWWSEVPLN